MTEGFYKSSGMHAAEKAGIETANLRKLVFTLWRKKYFMASSLIISLVVAGLFVKFSMPVYRVAATLLIEEDKKTTATGNEQLMDGFNLMAGLKNLDNQTLILSSRSLVSRVLEELPFDTGFFFKGVLSTRSLYPLKPIKIETSEGFALPEDVVFTFKYKGGDSFRINAEFGDGSRLNSTARFGEPIVLPGGKMVISRNGPEFSSVAGKKLFFIYHSRRALVADYTDRIIIEPATKKGTIMKVSIEGTNKAECLAFLERLTLVFINLSLEKKNEQAVRTIGFIDDQLAGITDSLLITENRLQKFRSRNRVTNLSAQGQVIITQAMNLENEKARLALEAGYYQYMSEYLAKENRGEIPIAPATMGIVDPGLTRLVTDLTEAQSQLGAKSIGEKNPLQAQLERKINNIKSALDETLKGLIQANSLAIKDNLQQIKATNERASELPGTERELLGIERKYKLNDELYTFLLEKRAVAQMQKASNTADNEIIDYPEAESYPVKPKHALVWLLAFIAGTGFPALWIILEGLFNIRVNEIDEIEAITDLPVTGYIPHYEGKKGLAVFSEPDSAVSESFRLLRSRLKFFTKDVKSPVILVTSAMAAEGKTFTAINLAAAYSIMGRKTVLIGFDLRQPKINTELELDNSSGITSWLIGRDSLTDIIKKTSYQNLDVITSGPVPPNPAELTAMDKTIGLFQYLKQNYECIIVDSSPAGIVSDTSHLASLADATIIVTRINITVRSMLADTVSDLRALKAKGLSVSVNDLVSGSGRYGYQARYKHHYYKNHNKVENLKVQPVNIDEAKVGTDVNGMRTM